MSLQRTIVFLLLMLAVSAARADQRRILRVTVRSGSGRSVYIDEGSDAGVTTGLRVRFIVPGTSPIDGIVQAVTTHTARVEVPAGVQLPPPGTHGALELPDDDARRENDAPDPREGKAPDHPPWSREESRRTPDMPLLAPAFGEPPKERAFRLDGRIFSQVLITQDQGDDRDNDYFVGRLGTWLQATNPFGAGGRIELAGELDYRNARVAFDPDAEFQPILNVASYTLGDEYYSPAFLQLGRFYPSNLPEIGIIDGAAGGVQLENGVRAGAGFGVYPLPFPDRDWGADLSLHFFVDYHSKEPGFLSAVLAYQKTWHRGEPDRDLVLGRVTAQPMDKLWIYAGWWIDIYTAGDVLKGPGADLTQLWVQARCTPTANTSFSATYSHFTWPETKRQQFQDMTPELILRGSIDRFGASGSHNLSEDLRLFANADFWADQDRRGLGAAAGVDWFNAENAWPALQAQVFYTEGSFNEGAGLRLKATYAYRDVDAYLGYELFYYNTSGFAGTGYQLRQILRAGVGWRIGHMRYTASGDLYFGEGEGAYTAGLFAEYDF